MGEIVSLNKFRKERRRRADAARAARGHGGDKPSLAKLNQESSREGDAFDSQRLGDRPKPGPQGA
ncbi:MAG: hypothetical protein ACE5JZ_08000 [Kiloniellales bacterium]